MYANPSTSFYLSVMSMWGCWNPFSDFSQLLSSHAVLPAILRKESSTRDRINFVNIQNYLSLGIECARVYTSEKNPLSQKPTRSHCSACTPITAWRSCRAPLFLVSLLRVSTKADSDEAVRLQPKHTRRRYQGSHIEDLEISWKMF